MAFKKTFVVSDETVNSYGFVVVTAGISLDNAKENCPAFYDHKTWEIPLGHWENFRVENNRLLADIIINGDNEREKQYIKKIENGDIKGCSIGADCMAWSEEPALLKQGQTRPTLTQCELFEVSITPLPGNTSAMALKYKGNLVTLNATNTNEIVPLLTKKANMKSIALKLGLSETATEDEILAAIARVQLAAQTANTSEENMRVVVIESATEGLSAEQKEIFVTLAKTDIAQAMKFVKLSQPAVAEETAPAGTVIKKEATIASLIKKPAAETAAADGKDSFDYLQKHNPVELKRIHKEDPDKYAELAKGYSNGIRYIGK